MPPRGGSAPEPVRPPRHRRTRPRARPRRAVALDCAASRLVHNEQPTDVGSAARVTSLPPTLRAKSSGRSVGRPEYSGVAGRSDRAKALPSRWRPRRHPRPGATRAATRPRRRRRQESVDLSLTRCRRTTRGETSRAIVPRRHSPRFSRDLCRVRRKSDGVVVSGRGRRAANHSRRDAPPAAALPGPLDSTKPSAISGGS